VSEAAGTIPGMDSIIDFGAWRRRREKDVGDDPERADMPATDAGEASVDRLERAVQKLHGVVSRALDAGGRLQPRVETELLAIMGELTVGLVVEAAARAERLADRIAAGKGGGSW
jgi:hypothetical protein